VAVHSLTAPDRAVRWRTRATPYLLLLPAFLVLGAIIFYPVLRAIGLSFQNYNLVEPQNRGFIGLANYVHLFTRDAVFWQAAGLSLRWVVVNVVVQLLIGALFALVLNEEFRGRAIVRGLILVPWVMPSSVTGLMWIFMFDGQFGIVNEALVRLGLFSAPIPFLSRPEYALWAIIVASIWYGVPFFTIMLLAGLQSISRDYYEAASVDGADAWQRFWHVTLPLWWPMIFIVTLLRTIWLSQYVEIIYIMTGGGPVHYSTTIPVYGYVTSIIKLDFGYAAAIAVSLAAVMMVVAYLYLRLARRWEIAIR
jgi:multiple sugar transport system permease protein